jgi:essential nuclear protein 1
MLGMHAQVGQGGAAVADSDDAESSDEEGSNRAGDYGAVEAWIEQEISAEDEAALAAFAAPDQERRPARSLSDIILDKIRAKQEAGEGLAPLPE